jgi:hypothetical protein
MKRLVGVGIAIIFFVLIFGGVSIGASGSRLLKEIVSADQKVKYAQSRPVIVSKKHYRVNVAPESVLIDPKTSIKFTLVIHNPHGDPLHFSIDNVKAYEGKKTFPLLKPEKVVVEVRKEYSAKKLKLTKEQAKMLEPFVEDKMQRLRDKMLKDQIIASQKTVVGLIAIEVPMGVEKLTIEVTTPKDTHTFLFNLFEL